MTNNNLKIDKTYIIFIMVISLFCGLMVASAGLAIYPPLVKITEPIVGKIRIESEDYSYKPGQSGTSISFYLVNNKGAEEDRTLYCGFIAFLIYSVIIFILFLAYRFISILRLGGKSEVQNVLPDVK